MNDLVRKKHQPQHPLRWLLSLPPASFSFVVAVVGYLLSILSINRFWGSSFWFEKERDIDRERSRVKTLKRELKERRKRELERSRETVKQKEGHRVIFEIEKKNKKKKNIFGKRGKNIELERNGSIFI